MNIMTEEKKKTEKRKNVVIVMCKYSVVVKGIERKLTDISEGIKNGTTSIIGKMKEEHVADVLEMVRASKIISDRHKKMFFY